MNILPDAVVYYGILTFLTESDHIKYARSSKNNQQYNIKKYKQRYNIEKIPENNHNKLTNIIIKQIDKIPISLTSLSIYDYYFNQPLDELPKQ